MGDQFRKRRGMGGISLINQVLKGIGIILITAFSSLFFHKEAGTLYFGCMLFPVLLGGFGLFSGARHLFCYRTNRKTRVAFEAIRAVVGSLLCLGAIIVLCMDVLCVEVYYVLGLIYGIAINIIGIVFEKPYPNTKNYTIFCAVIWCVLGFSLLRPLAFFGNQYRNPVDMLGDDFFAAYALAVIVPLLLAQWELFFGIRYLLFEKNKSILKTVFSWGIIVLSGVLCCVEIGVMFGMTINLDVILSILLISLPFHITNIFTYREA